MTEDTWPYHDQIPARKLTLNYPSQLVIKKTTCSLDKPTRLTAPGTEVSWISAS